MFVAVTKYVRNSMDSTKKLPLYGEVFCVAEITSMRSY